MAGILVATLPLLAACGQKGPLYLPPAPPAPQSTAPGTTATPAPATTPADARKPSERPYPDVPATTEPR